MLGLSHTTGGRFYFLELFVLHSLKGINTNGRVTNTPITKEIYKIR